MAPADRRTRRPRWHAWRSLNDGSEGESSSSQNRGGGGGGRPQHPNAAGGAWAETICGSCGKGSVYNRHIQQTPFCAKCGARFVLQTRRREETEEASPAMAPAAPPAPIAALYERHLARGDSDTASALLEQWPALAGKPAAAPDAPVQSEN